MIFDEISKNHAQILSCFGLGANAVYNLTIFPSLLISFLSFFHNSSTTNCRYLSMCVHTFHQPYGYPPFTLFSWQQVHMNPWCNHDTFVAITQNVGFHAGQEQLHAFPSNTFNPFR
jgi:hypothetical protein